MKRTSNTLSLQTIVIGTLVLCGYVAAPLLVTAQSADEPEQRTERRIVIERESDADRTHIMNGDVAQQAVRKYLRIGTGAHSGGFLGIYGGEVDEETVETLNLPGEYGALVKKVMPETSAESAGLRENDVIVGFNGDRVESMAQLQRMLRETPAGRSVVLEIVRDGSRQTVSTELGERPSMSESFEFDDDMLRHLPNKDFNWKEYMPDSNIFFNLEGDIDSAMTIVDSSGAVIKMQLRALTDELSEFDDEKLRKKLEDVESMLREVDTNLKDIDVDVRIFRSMPHMQFDPLEPDGEWNSEMDGLEQGYMFIPRPNGPAPQIFTRTRINDKVRLGVSVQSLSPQLARYFQLDDDKTGALISEVHDGYPAAAAELKAGDVIVSIDGISVDRPIDVSRIIRNKEGTITVTIVRDGSPRDITVDLGERTETPEADLFEAPETEVSPELNNR